MGPQIVEHTNINLIDLLSQNAWEQSILVSHHQ
jgi:hypothetical protein